MRKELSLSRLKFKSETAIISHHHLPRRFSITGLDHGMYEKGPLVPRGRSTSPHRMKFDAHGFLKILNPNMVVTKL